MALSVADSRERSTVLHELFIQTELLVDGLHQRKLIVVVVDGELTRKAIADFGQSISVAAQHSDAEGVKCREHGRARLSLATEQTKHALAHLLGRFVRKGDGQDGGSGHVMVLDQMRDSMRNDASFSTACAGEQQQRSFNMLDSFTLLRI